MKKVAQGTLSILFLTFIISAVVVFVLGTISWLFDISFVYRGDGSELVDGDMAFNLIATAFLLFCAGVVWVLMEFKQVWALVKTYPLLSVILLGAVIAVAIPINRISSVYGNGGPLPNAVTTQDHEEVKRLLASAEFEQEVLDRQLQRALNEGYLEIATTLIEHGANIFQLNESGGTLLHHAVSSSKLETIEFLLDQGVDPNHVNDLGYTALYNLLSWGPYERKPLSAKNQQEPTALEIEMELCEIMNMLLEAGADLSLNDERAKLIQVSEWRELRTIQAKLVDG